VSIEIAELRTELREHLGVDETELDNTQADLLLNRAYWELLDKFPFREKEVTITFPTVAGTRLYDVPSPFEALRLLSVEDLDDFSHKTLDRMSVLEYEKKYVNQEDSQAKPTHYVREGCAVRLYPTPDDVYTLTMKYWTVLADLSDSNTDPCIPQSWHELILFGGIWRGYLRFGDYQRANNMKAHQVNLINSQVPTESKEEIDSPYAGIEVKMNEYDA
jgi:hypothetical protein